MTLEARVQREALSLGAQSRRRLPQLVKRRIPLRPGPNEHGHQGKEEGVLPYNCRDYRPRREVALVADLAREQLRAHARGIIDLEMPV
jgi:hypothetical protein